MSARDARFIELFKMERAEIVKIAKTYIDNTSAFGYRRLINIILDAEFGGN